MFWDLEKYEVIREFVSPESEEDRVACVLLSRDGKKAIVGYDLRVYLWSTETGEIVQVLQIPSVDYESLDYETSFMNNYIIGLKLSSDERCLVAKHYFAESHWDLATGEHQFVTEPMFVDDDPPSFASEAQEIVGMTSDFGSRLAHGRNENVIAFTHEGRLGLWRWISSSNGTV